MSTKNSVTGKNVILHKPFWELIVDMLIDDSIQQIMRYHGAKGNLSTSSEAVELDDKFDVLVDANDQVLEWVVSVTDNVTSLYGAPLTVCLLVTTLTVIYKCEVLLF